MNFTLIATCYNEIKSIHSWITDIKGQTRKPDEIIIVDSESTDGTIEVLNIWAEEDETVKVIVEKCNAARGRNIATSAAANDVIICTDMGCRMDRKWFEEMTKVFDDNPETEVVMGNFDVDPNSTKTLAQRAEGYSNGGQMPFKRNERGEYELLPFQVPSNRSMGLTRKVWKDLNGWPEDLTLYADDALMGAQMVARNYRISIAPNAVVYWHRHERLRGYFKETFGYGRGDGEAYIKVPFAFRVYKKGLVPGSFVPPLNGLRLMQLYCAPRNLLAALSKFDLPALFLIPILGFGKGWSFGKGYLAGYRDGSQRCLQSRKRAEETFYAPRRA